MRETVKVHLALVAVSVIYGFFYIAVKLLLREVAQSELILLRFILTAVIVGLLEAFLFKTKFQSWKEIVRVSFLAVLGVFIVQCLIVMGVQKTTAFHSALIMSTSPIWTLLFSLLIGRERFHINKLMGISMAFIGVTLLLFSKNPDTPLPATYLIGDVLILFAALAFAWFLLASQDLLKQYNSYSLMAYCYIISAICFFGVHLGTMALGWTPMNYSFLEHISATGWGLIIYIVLFASILSYTLNNFALRRVSPSVVSAYIFIQPVLSAVLGFYILNEPFNWSMGIATLVTFVGVMMATAASHRDYIEKEQADEISVRDPL